jgi:pimeloyl-ACP methyl ester carboxylesterase
VCAAPNADLILPLMRFSGTRKLSHWLFALLRQLDTDLGVDAVDLLRVFDTLPDLTARRAFLRTLRSVVDWRGQAITMLDRCYLTQGMPTLLVWGSRDAVIPMHHAEIAHAAMPGSKLEIFDGAGHFPFRTEPARFLRVLESFLEQSEPANYSSNEWRELLRKGPPERKPVALAH